MNFTDTRMFLRAIVKVVSQSVASCAQESAFTLAS